jgi:DNA-binding winged helix-turn-helix (wHTH) protein
MRVRFGSYVLDRGTRQLIKDGDPRSLEPKAFELLDLLIARRPQAVSKQEIHDRLWPRTFVSESTLSSLAAQLRRALGGRPGEGALVRTVHGFGYAFGAEAREEGEGAPPPAIGHVEWGGEWLPLRSGENVIGRGPEASIRIEARGVSRRHARIVSAGGLFTVEDLGSKNGTYLRGQRLEQPASLADGDELGLGRTTLVFRMPRPGTTSTEM